MNKNKIEIPSEVNGIWLPRKLLENSELSYTEKLFLPVILSLDNEKNCFASNSYFSRFFGISQRAVSKIIKSLSTKNFIRVSILKGNQRIIEMTSKGFALFMVTDRTKVLPPLNKSSMTGRTKVLPPVEQSCISNYNINKGINKIINKSDLKILKDHDKAARRSISESRELKKASEKIEKQIYEEGWLTKDLFKGKSA